MLIVRGALCGLAQLSNLPYYTAHKMKLASEPKNWFVAGLQIFYCYWREKKQCRTNPFSDEAFTLHIIFPNLVCQVVRNSYTYTINNFFCYNVRQYIVR